MIKKNQDSLGKMLELMLAQNQEHLHTLLQDTMEQIRSTIDAPDTQYQKDDENDIQYQSETTIISTTMITRPICYDLQGMYNRNKQYRESLHILEAHVTVRTHPIGLLEITISLTSTITIKPQTTTPHSPTFAPTEELVPLTH
eukprot:scaffold421347_cov94-Attheya_sp.AAC.1